MDSKIIIELDERNTQFLEEILISLKKDTYLELIPEDIPRILQILHEIKRAKH